MIPLSSLLLLVLLLQSGLAFFIGPPPPSSAFSALKAGTLKTSFDLSIKGTVWDIDGEYEIDMGSYEARNPYQLTKSDVNACFLSDECPIPDENVETMTHKWNQIPYLPTQDTHTVFSAFEEHEEAEEGHSLTGEWGML